MSALEQYSAVYARGGLPALSDAVAGDRLAGRTEGLVVRVAGRSGQAVFASVPGAWEATGVEVASARLPDGVVFEVAKSSEARADILARFRSRGLLGFVAVLLLGTAGGALAARSGIAPLRRLAAVLGGIVRTGQVTERVPVPATATRSTTSSRLVNEHARPDRVAARRPCAARSTTSPTTCARRCSGCVASAESALHDGGEEAARAALGTCLEECDRVAATLTTLMDISEAETGAMALLPEALDARTLLEDTAELYEDVGRGEGRRPRGGRAPRARRRRRPHAAAAGARQPRRQRRQVHAAGRARRLAARGGAGPCRHRVRGRRARHPGRTTSRGSGTASTAATAAGARRASASASASCARSRRPTAARRACARAKAAAPSFSSPSPPHPVGLHSCNPPDTPP